MHVLRAHPRAHHLRHHCSRDSGLHPPLEPLIESEGPTQSAARSTGPSAGLLLVANSALAGVVEGAHPAALCNQFLSSSLNPSLTKHRCSLGGPSEHKLEASIEVEVREWLK